MRSLLSLRAPVTPLLLAAPLLLCACSGGGSGSGETSTAPSATATASAPPSPFSVALEAKNPLVLSGLLDGIVVADSGKKQWAVGLNGGELAPAAMPAGLPDGEGHIVRFAGRAPKSVWMTYEIPGEDKKSPRHPLYRLDIKKNEWKRYAEDWRPHLVSWLEGRIVAASTSSGKLKMKVMEPYSAKGKEDLFNPKVEDAACQKGLRVEAFAALSSGTLLMAGNCKPEGAPGKRYVLLRWRAGEEVPAAYGTGGAAKAGPPATATATASASAAVSAAPSASASAAVSAAPSASASAAVSAAPTASASADAAGDAKEADAEESSRPKGKVFVVPGVDGNLVHHSLSATGDTEVWMLGEEEKGHKFHLYRFDAAKIEEVSLPELKEPARQIAMGKDGALWLVTQRSIWRRGADGAWQSVPPPSGTWNEADPEWEMFDVVTSGLDEVWISARCSSKAASRHALLRLKPAKSALKWE